MKVRVLRMQTKNVWICICILKEAIMSIRIKGSFSINIFFVVTIFSFNYCPKYLHVFHCRMWKLTCFPPRIHVITILLSSLVLDLWLKNLLSNEVDIIVETKFRIITTFTIISVHQTMNIYPNISKYQKRRKFSFVILLTIRSVLLDCMHKKWNLKEQVYLWIVFVEIYVFFKDIWRGYFFTDSFVNWLWKIYAGLLSLFL